MIVVDTNVVSELMKPSPSTNVLTWIDEQIGEDLFLTAITVAEIDYGLSILPDGVRRDSLRTAFEKVVEEGFAFRVLPFDENAARFYGQIMSHNKNLGRLMSLFDGQIASIAHAHKAAVATRNIKDFDECGLVLINPFEDMS
ncbi:MAG TPA: type II toxin-antitoxin system VapC family toxin [Myxococcota bacterium]|nr:type II toxin-antitoxin system VapC family toxin [Myxococcota bacterium]